jgi:hypothetical protein
MQRADTKVASVRGAAGRSVKVRRGLRRWMGAASRWLVEHRLVLATGLAAAVPILVSTVEVVAAGWVPYSDDAVVAVRAFDVFTTHPPLLGQWSSGYSGVVGTPTYGLGPLLFWLLAVPAHAPWPGSFEIAIGLLNVASVMGAVGLAHRRGGGPLMFAVAIAIPVMCASLPAEVYSDIWNPSAALLPFTLLIFLAWSLACGEFRLLPLTVLVGSFVSQCHLGYAVPVLGAIVVGLVGLAISRASASSQARAPNLSVTADKKGSVRRWGLAAILVGLVCFSAPLLEQAIHRPGNLVLLVRAATADEPTVGLEAGWRAVVHTIGIVPWWLRDPQVPIERIADLSVGPSVVATASAVLALVAVIAITLVGWMRHRIDVASAGALGLTLCFSLVLVTASTPKETFPTVGYTIRWASPAGMWLWLALGWSIATLSPVRSSLARRRQTVAALASVGVVAVVAGLVAAGGELRDEPHDEMRTINDRVVAELRSEEGVRVDASSGREASFMALGFHAGLVYALRREGHEVSVPMGPEVFGGAYDVDAGVYERTVRVDVDRPAPERGRLIVRLAIRELPDPGDPFAPKIPPVRDVRVTLIPAPSAR